MRRAPRMFNAGWQRYVMAVAIVGIVVAVRAYVIPAWSLAHPYLGAIPVTNAVR